MQTSQPDHNPSSNKKAYSLLALQFLSDFGDQIANALLALCLLDITSSTTKVGSVYLVTTLGYVCFTFIGGWVGDHLSRRKVLVSCDVARGFVVLLMIVALGQKSIVLIYATSFLLAILDSLHRPVKFSAWTDVVPRSKLERFTSLSELSNQGSTIFGPLIASTFLLFGWKSIGFAFDALTFFICALVFARIVPNNLETKKVASVKHDFLKGFKLIAQRVDIAKYVAYDAIQMIGFGAFNATFLVLAQRDFGWTKADYSYHLSIIALFTVVGAFLGATDFVLRIEPKRKLTVCALASAFALFFMLQWQTFPYSSVLFGICDGLSVLTMAVTRTRVQIFAKEYYPEYLTSIIAARGLIIKGATLFGTGACLMIDDFMSLETTLFLFVIPIGLSCLPFFVDKTRARHASRAHALSVGSPRMHKK